jgi:hypothetical protein
VFDVSLFAVELEFALVISVFSSGSDDNMGFIVPRTRPLSI